MTKRGDFMMTVNLFDDTHNEDPITLVMFEKDANKLPRIRRVGDVLRMHRVLIQVRTTPILFVLVWVVRYTIIICLSDTPCRSSLALLTRYGTGKCNC
jgi:hypothetical protein